jgi:hypothetical protein
MRLQIDVNCNHACLFWASERMIDWKKKWVDIWLRDVMESVAGRWGNWAERLGESLIARFIDK